MGRFSLILRPIPNFFNVIYMYMPTEEEGEKTQYVYGTTVLNSESFLHVYMYVHMFTLYSVPGFIIWSELTRTQSLNYIYVHLIKNPS